MKVQDDKALMEEGASRPRQSCRKASGLEDTLASLGPQDGIEELRNAVSSLPRWSAFREAAKYGEWSLQLKRVIEIFAEYKNKVNAARDPMEKVAIISDLEQELADSSGLSQTVIGLFAVEVESHVRNCGHHFPVPSTDNLIELQDKLGELSKSTFGTPFTVLDWADYQHKPRATLIRLQGAGFSEEEVKKHMEEAASRDMFLSQLSEGFTKVVYEFCASFSPTTTGHKTMMGVAFNGFFEALDKGEIQWFCSDVFGKSQCARVYDKRKKYLGWTNLGSLVTELVQKKLLEEPKETPTSALRCYKKLGIVLIPNFMEKLTMLLATVDAKVAEAEFMKTKAIAAAVSLFITGTPIVVKLIYRASGFEEEDAA